MQSKLKNRIGNLELKRNVAVELLDRTGYAILAFVALLASAITTEWSIQFIVLSIILGLKWIFESQRTVIQILMQEKGGDNDDRGC